MAKPNKGNKGVFGPQGLPVSQRYIDTAARNRFVLPGLAIAALLALMLAANFFVGTGRMISNGPLSTSHAAIEDSCASCHTAFDVVSDDKCLTCHTRGLQDTDIYAWASHNIYRSGDPERAAGRGGEISCARCHREHRGRNADVTHPADGRCQSCHAVGRFAPDHPEFEALAAAIADNGNLKFTHAKHVARLRETDDGTSAEGACASCHVPDSLRRGFEPVSFDLSCSNCHLGSRTRVLNLPTRDADTPIVEMLADGVSITAGVETIETLQARRGPGEEWALAANPTDFRGNGSLVTKTRLSHRDPWLMHNLEQLRKAMYPTAAAAGLLASSAEPVDGSAAVYAEAMSRLRTRAAGLRTQPETWLQEELDALAVILDDTEARLAAARPEVDPSWLVPSEANALIPDEDFAELADLSGRLGEACAQCHQIAEATIRRVQHRQRTLWRAEFDHRSHVTEVSCLGCHTAIDMSAATVADAPEDDASILNLPGVGRCQGCHTAGLAPARCDTCHLFHPQALPDHRRP